VLTGLRDALFTSGLAANPAADAARQAFGTAGQFDRIWTLISVGAIATLRDVRQAHPPELIRPARKDTYSATTASGATGPS